MTPKKASNIDSTEPIHPDSNTSVYIGLNEPRGVCSFRGNKKLFNAFKNQLKADSLSVCHVLEPVMLAYLTKRVYKSNTIEGVPPLVIENFNVARVLKRLRRIGVEEVVTETVVKTETVKKKTVKFVDYSCYSLEDLQEAYDNSVGYYTKRMMIRGEFNRRGIVPEVS